ncbi:MAG: hypothetical protein K6A62_08535 [Bacteroidales bacterium]|nr:hypothetical protein [Bacteroidales bacterium]
MSSISKAGIFIDVKQLLEFTNRMVNEMSNADRMKYGNDLVRYNLEMISSFSRAFHRRDEHITFEAGGKTYDINLRGEKRTHVDALEAAFDSYQALMEFCFEDLTFSRMSRRKRRRRHKHFMELMDKLGTGIAKWSGSIYKQVVVSEKDGHGAG